MRNARRRFRGPMHGGGEPPASAPFAAPPTAMRAGPPNWLDVRV